VIRLNLMQNSFGSSKASRNSTDTGFLGDLTTTSMQVLSTGKGKKIGFAIAAVVVLGGLVAGGIQFMNRSPVDESLVPETASAPKTVAEKPVAQEAPKPAPAPVAKTDSVKTDTAKPVEAKVAKVEPPPPPKPEPKKPEPKPEPKKVEPVEAPKPAPAPPQTISVQPSVVAPALAGGVVDLVLGESKSKANAPAPSRFEDLSALSRLAYQRFAFERILSVVRQVAQPNLRFHSIRILSPGVLSIQGSAKDSGVIQAFVQGLLAQSLVDTSLVRKPNGQFALVARLPYSASFGDAEAASEDFQQTINQVRDLSASQGLDLTKPAAPKTQALAGMRRAQWKLSGNGSWDAVTKWISALQAVKSPVGFTSLKLTSGPDGKLRLEADAISYGK